MGNTKVRGDAFSKWIELVQKLHSTLLKLLNFLFCGDRFLFLALKIAGIQYSYKIVC